MDDRLFHGVWSSTPFGKMTLVQDGALVTGTYTRNHGGTIQGTAQQRRLEFRWQEQDGSSGWGFLRILPNTGTMVGLWGENNDRTQSNDLFAEPIASGRVDAHPPPQSDNLIEIKQLGCDLMHQRKYHEAIIILEQALEDYRADREHHSWQIMKDAHLISEAQILFALCTCYYHLTDYGTLQEAPPLLKQREDFYDKLLLHMEAAVKTYRQYLKDGIGKYSTEPLQKAEKMSAWLKECAQQLTDQMTGLQPGGQEQEARVAKMAALVGIFQQCSQSLDDSRAKIVRLETTTFGSEAVFAQSFTLLSHYLGQMQQQVNNCIDAMAALSKHWTTNEKRLIEGLHAMLAPFAFEIGLKSTLITRTRASENAHHSVQDTQEAVARLAPILERWRGRLASDRTKIMALDKGKAFFQKLVQLLVDLGGEQDALLFSEAARARAFADLLASKETIKQTLLHNRADDHQPSPLSAPSVTLATLIETVAKHNSTTIEYFICEHNVIIWVITPAGTIKVCQYGITEQRLDEMVHRLLDLLKQAQVQEVPMIVAQTGISVQTAMTQALEELYTYLIAPIPAEWLPAQPEEVITIVPHGSLFQVPFAALRHHATGFIEAHAHVLAPSIDLLRYTAEHAHRLLHADQPNLLAFVNPAPMPEESFMPLVVTEQHAPALREFYTHDRDNSILTGRAAEKQRLLQEAAHYTTILFATHGEAFDEDPVQSYLALARVPPDDGYLRMSDIYRLDLHADLIILSACETGRGKISGDGIIGLSRAFIYAGASSVLMSLWQIPEKESMWQVDLFHQYWREEGLSKALWKTQRSFCENYPERPDLWAGFVLFGEWQ
jgi:CHAT domain-containing protein